MKYNKINLILILIILLLVPNEMFGEPNEVKKGLTNEEIRKIGADCEAHNQHYVFSVANSHPKVMWNGKSYDAYCIDRGMSKGSTCYTCEELANDADADLFRRAFAKRTGDYATDRALFQFMGFKTSQFQADVLGTDSGLDLAIDYVENSQLISGGLNAGVAAAIAGDNESTTNALKLMNEAVEEQAAADGQLREDTANSSEYDSNQGAVDRAEATEDSGNSADAELTNAEVNAESNIIIVKSNPVMDNNKYHYYLAPLAGSNKPKSTSLTITVQSIVNQKVTFKVTSPSDNKNSGGNLKVQALSGQVIEGESHWNGSSGVVVVDESKNCSDDGKSCTEEKNCEVGIIVAFGQSDIVKCVAGGQQFVAKIDAAEADGAGINKRSGNGITVGKIDSSDKDKDIKSASVTGQQYKEKAPAYYKDNCEQKDECSGNVPEPGGEYANCCAEGGYIKAHQPKLDELFCDDNNLGVEKFKRLKGSDEYIKQDAKYTKDANAEKVASKYCTVYCTQRIYGQIPGASSGTNGLYFELTKDTSDPDWGTASAYLQGTKRCRVRIDYDAWWKVYEDLLNQEIEGYNMFMENQAIYRYIDDNADDNHNKMHRETESGDETYVIPHAVNTDRTKVNYDPSSKNNQCTCTITKQVTDGRNDKKQYYAKPSYHFAELRFQENYYYYKIDWDRDKFDKYIAVEVGKDKQKILAKDLYPYKSICDQDIKDIIDERKQKEAELRGSPPSYTTIQSGCCNLGSESPPDPQWTLDIEPLVIESYEATNWRPTDAWEDAKKYYENLANTGSDQFNRATKEARYMEQGLDACNAYFYAEPENYTSFTVADANGYDARKNYKLNTTYSFDYDQIFLNTFGNLQEFTTTVPFKPAPKEDNNNGNACWYLYDAKAFTTEGKSSVDAEDGTGTDIYESRYSKNIYNKYSYNGVKETFDDFYDQVVGKFKVENEDSQFYTAIEPPQPKDWYDKFLHKHMGELKLEGGRFANDKRFNIDGMYKMKCRWEEVERKLYTFIPSGSSSSMTTENNITSHDRMYQIYITTLKGTYDIHHHIGCIGEYCVFDNMVEDGPACANGRRSTEDDGESAMTCQLIVDYSIIFTGICNPNQYTAQLPDCKLFGNDYNLFEFKIADPKDILPNVTAGNYTYADNWFTSKGQKAKSEIEANGKKDKTYDGQAKTYAFKLTPNMLKVIKAYNGVSSVNGGYSDFSLICECAEGAACNHCKSSFLTALSNGTLLDMKEKAWNNKTSIEAIRSSNSHVRWKENH